MSKSTSNITIGNVEFMIQILREVSALADSIAELKVSTDKMERDIQDIKKKLSLQDTGEGLSQDTEEGCCYDY